MKRLVLLFFVFSIVGGCGMSNIPLTGSVKFDDGVSLTGGTVMLSTDAQSFIGQIDKDGNFTMRNSNNKLGIPAGNYAINVSSIPSYGEPDLVVPASAEPSSVEVVSGKIKKLEITVKRAKNE
jgi:hypothetical protein